ncbi:EF-hand calcium-binding domain-containing protein 4B-like isoform X2 [Paramormyrops kingsleyae]|uniref:Calcium release activated channel regulator 2A n=1 Tax=Paramormyrops kingsleyae TaxID=1676925 RepID=A0A3B3R902_9TELE|nr:EF-hand calcium-binding domain-containing protein 4B-like isoform X2 [Paramormyrops kingsleyae]
MISGPDPARGDPVSGGCLQNMAAELIRSPSKGPKGTDGGHTALLGKTQDFFQICDTEGKGFVTRRDMQRLCEELPLSSEDLEDVFDSLDADGNGYLTLEEFSSGFSEFLFGRRISVAEQTATSPGPASSKVVFQSQCDELDSSEDEEEKHFSLLMESLGASHVFEDPKEVRILWAELRRDEPHLQCNFEEFLARVTQQIKEANKERRDMESLLRRRTASHDDEIQRLYEEMEQQIQDEKDRIILQDSEHFLSRSQDLEHKLVMKEREMENLIQKQKKLERQCRDLHSERRETSMENVKLKQTNEELTRELKRRAQELALAQDQLGLLQEQSSHLHEDRDMEMYWVTESLQREKASLLKQLDLLREMNKHLRDERDMCYMKPRTPLKTPLPRSTSTPLQPADHKQANVSNEDEEEPPSCSWRKSSLGLNGLGPPLSQEVELAQGTGGRRHLPRIISIEEDPLPQLLQQDFQCQLPQWSEDEEGENVDPQTRGDTSAHGPSNANRAVPSSPRGRPVGKETIQNDEASISAPDHFFKIVLVGNSSVGKTSLLHRFCKNCFSPGTSATVGIDYSMKTVMVDSTQVAMQLWDTAGQERYHSITKQFFRKVDGVVIVYDITAEQSFIAVRHWLTSVQEGAGEDIPIMLLGNKKDKESERQVQARVGEALAKEFQLCFYECSAFSGQNVLESMVHLGKLLKEREDGEKEKTTQLVNRAASRRSCCLVQ